MLGICLAFFSLCNYECFSSTLVSADTLVDNKNEELLGVVYDNADVIDVVTTKEFFTFIKPLSKYTFTSSFGTRWGKMHKGVDLAVPQGTPVMASASGYVKKMEVSNTGYGINIIINHGDIGGYTYETRYAHCSSLANLHVGDYVEQGSVIAYSGNTGDSTGPHLHFEIIRNGTHIDPKTILDF